MCAAQEGRMGSGAITVCGSDSRAGRQFNESGPVRAIRALHGEESIVAGQQTLGAVEGARLCEAANLPFYSVGPYVRRGAMVWSREIQEFGQNLDVRCLCEDLEGIFQVPGVDPYT